MKRLCLFLALLLSPAAYAQQYSIDWYTIAGGGGTSTNGQYSLSGTIGQADAGNMSGGNFSLTGGFWSLFSVVQTPGAPFLSIQLTATNTALLIWPVNPAGFNLQQSPGLTPAGWGPVTNAPAVLGGENQVTVGLSPGSRFFRLKSP